MELVLSWQKYTLWWTVLAAMTMMPMFNGHQLSKKDFTGLKDMFSYYDENGDGHITTDELRKAMNYYGQNSMQSELSRVIAKVDVDENGKIEFPEFMLMMASQPKPTGSEEAIKQAFGIFDKDGNGYLSLGELSQGMASLGQPFAEKTIDGMLKAADKDGDGYLNSEGVWVHPGWGG